MILALVRFYKLFRLIYETVLNFKLYIFIIQRDAGFVNKVFNF